MDSALIIRTVLLFLLFVFGFAAEGPSAHIVESSAAPYVVASDRAEEIEDVRIDPWLALSNGKPTFIMFSPVEMCQIHYCLQPAQVANQIARYHTGQANLVYRYAGRTLTITGTQHGRITTVDANMLNYRCNPA